MDNAGLVSSALTVECDIFQHGVRLHGNLQIDMQGFIGSICEEKRVVFLLEIDLAAAEGQVLPAKAAPGRVRSDSDAAGFLVALDSHDVVQEETDEFTRAPAALAQATFDLGGFLLSMLEGPPPEGSIQIGGSAQLKQGFAKFFSGIRPA